MAEQVCCPKEFGSQVVTAAELESEAEVLIHAPGITNTTVLVISVIQTTLAEASVTYLVTAKEAGVGFKVKSNEAVNVDVNWILFGE